MAEKIVEEKKGQGLNYSLKAWQKPIILIVILNVNGINSPVKRQRLSMDLKNKQTKNPDSTISYLKEIHYKYEDKDR